MCEPCGFGCIWIKPPKLLHYFALVSVKIFCQAPGDLANLQGMG
jgi:hypothetical protein